MNMYVTNVVNSCMALNNNYDTTIIDCNEGSRSTWNIYVHK